MFFKSLAPASRPAALTLVLPLASIALFHATANAADSSPEPTPLSPILVEGQMESSPYPVPLQSAMPHPDAAELLKQAPGAHVNRNGSLSGIVQYRGLFGDRVSVTVDGLSVAPSCSNAMDTPLSHAPSSQLDSLELVRGIAPVSAAMESLGGQVQAQLRKAEFADSEPFALTGQAKLDAAQVNRSAAASVFGAYANNQHKFYADLSLETGDDSDFANGEIRPTGYQRARYATGYGFRNEANELSFDLTRNETGDSGTPSLPMDILYADNTLAVLDYRYQSASLPWHIKLAYSTTEHAMTNFVLRDAPNGKTRRSDTEADSISYRLDTQLPVLEGTLSLGTDAQLASHAASITNPNQAMFYVDNFNDVKRDLFGLFAEWQGALSKGWNAQLGLRVNQVEMDAGTVRHSMSMMMPPVAMLQQRFNAAERSQSDTNVDWTLQLDRHLGHHSKLILGLARKTRTPSYQERYLWIPLEATAGLADGNLYVGDIHLKPEVSHQLELGLDWGHGRFWAMPRAFYRDISDYIQGTPAQDQSVRMIAQANGDASPLQFSNVDAEIYGLDSNFGARLNQRWHLSATISYARGKRQDIRDDLYRVAPLSGSVTLDYQRERWNIGLQTQFADNQSKVSQTNEESQTPGFAVYNLFGSLALNEKLSLNAGLANILDRVYAEHTSGINRVINSDIGLRERVPANGRNLYASLSYSL